MKLIKRCTNALLALAALAALASCYFPGNQTGRMELAFAPSKQTHSEQIVVRVYLLADGLLFSTDGRTPFSAEVPVGSAASEVRVSIEGLPVGPRYRALVGYGMVEPWGFQVWQFGESGEFAVSPGGTTSVPVPMETNPLLESGHVAHFSDLLGKNLKSVVTGDGTSYAAEERKLYAFGFSRYGDSQGFSLYDELSLAELVDRPAVSSRRINSLSADRIGFSGYGAFLNTDDGIIPFLGGDGWGFDEEFSSGLPGHRSILESGTLRLGGEQPVLFFRRAGGIGGRVDWGEGPLTWINLDLAGVLDMTVSESYAYFATTGEALVDKGKAFALPPEFLDDGDLMKRIQFSAPAPILSVDFKPSGVSAGGTLHMGTTDGAWVVTVTEQPGIIYDGQPTRVPGTEGRRIEMVAAGPYGYAAYLSRYWVFLQGFYGLSRLPFFAVIPGRATGLAWGDDWSEALFISGTEGLSGIYAGS